MNNFQKILKFTVENKSFIFIILFAFLFDGYLIGWASLNPYNFFYVGDGDHTCHHLAWVFFQNEPWHWPPGAIETQNIAARTSIGLTDSLPLVAFILKALGLAGNFQYLGLWQLSCLILMGVFGVLFARQWTNSSALQCLTAAFLIIAPVLLLRLVWQSALSAQWLIVASLYFYQKPWRFAPWAVLVGMVALIHPYLMAMVLPIALFKAAFSKKWWAIVCFLALSLMLVYLAGYFEGNSLQDHGFGYARARFYSFFRPELSEFSLFLGFGVLALTVILAISRFFYKNKIQFLSKESKGLCLCVFLILVFAMLTPRFGHWWLLGDLGNTFRINGRFGWVFVYFFTLFVCAGIIQTFSKKIAIFLLAGAFLWQISSLHPWHNVYAENVKIMAERRANPRAPMLAMTELQTYAQNAKTLIIFKNSEIVPRVWWDYVFGALPFARYAANHQLQTNFLCQARPDRKGAFAFQNQIFADLKNGKRDVQTLYVFLNDYSAEFLKENLPPEIAADLVFFEKYTLLPTKN